MLALRTTWGEWRVEHDRAVVLSIQFPPKPPREAKPLRVLGRVRPELQWLADFLEAYGSKRPQQVTTPRLPSWGTDFQRAVWRELGRIPFGQVRSYGEIAGKVKRSGASRAVGTACGSNPWPMLIPCHRVVRSDLSTGGFSGGPGWKKWLLKFEGHEGTKSPSHA
ncbi:MAG: methylated-DNA--[protein]-cysteine S-methyltransferase [Verrucomicrobiae bacterium]|nr:methylated-DNA--[protein]-cysteine S-methyltransferase [Verrucomicrobiae bacterium]